MRRNDDGGANPAVSTYVERAYFLLLLVLPMSPDEVELAAPPGPPVFVPERPVVGAPGSPGLPETKLPVPCGPVFACQLPFPFLPFPGQAQAQRP